MAANLYPIYTQTLSTTAASITFNNIPQNFTDLKIMHSVRDNTTPAAQYHSNNIYLRLNGDSSSLYSATIFYSSSSAVSTARNIAGNAAIYIGTVLNANGVANSFGSGEVYITGYSSGKFKQVLGETSNVSNVTTLDGAYQVSTTGLYRSTNPITSISLVPVSGSFVANSTFTLYGILKPGNAPKATGGQITSDDKYWYHTFKTTGASTFIPNQDLGGECLVIAGGGSGGYGGPGGGGAGGVLAGVGTFLRGNSYTVTVGAGGTFPAVGNTIGNSGQNSSISGNGFRTITAIGGGGGGAPTAVAGLNGGSGGGSGEAQPTTYGLGTYGQGYDGNVNNGGGGGAGGPGARGYGQNAGAARTGVGGIGTSAYTFWGIATGTGQNVSTLFYYAGGGAGYGSAAGGAIVYPVAGGLGGGGVTNVSGTANTGGGGGADGGSGGSGVVIVRYPL
jgi:hypothetical protein